MTEATITPAISAFIAQLPREGWRLSGGWFLRHGDCCPLTVATRQYADDWDMCYQAQGLTLNEAYSIINAADKGLLQPDRYDPALRAALLVHCGLTERR